MQEGGGEREGGGGGERLDCWRIQMGRLHVSQPLAPPRAQCGVRDGQVRWRRGHEQSQRRYLSKDTGKGDGRRCSRRRRVRKGAEGLRVGRVRPKLNPPPPLHPPPTPPTNPPLRHSFGRHTSPSRPAASSARPPALARGASRSGGSPSGGREKKKKGHSYLLLGVQRTRALHVARVCGYFAYASSDDRPRATRARETHSFPHSPYP